MIGFEIGAGIICTEDGVWGLSVNLLLFAQGAYKHSGWTMLSGCWSIPPWFLSWRCFFIDVCTCVCVCFSFWGCDQDGVEMFPVGFLVCAYVLAN